MDAPVGPNNFPPKTIYFIKKGPQGHFERGLAYFWRHEGCLGHVNHFNMSTRFDQDNETGRGYQQLEKRPREALEYGYLFFFSLLVLRSQRWRHFLPFGRLHCHGLASIKFTIKMLPLLYIRYNLCFIFQLVFLLPRFKNCLKRDKSEQKGVKEVFLSVP